MASHDSYEWIYPANVFVLGPNDARTTIVYATGFVKSVLYGAGLSLDPNSIRCDSMFGPLLLRGDVRIVLFEHPSRPVDPEIDFPEITRHLRGNVIIGGLSRGGQVMAQYHRWLLRKWGPDAWRRIALALVSTPSCVEDLVQAKMTRRFEQFHVPDQLGGPLIRLLGQRLFVTSDAVDLLTDAGRVADIGLLREAIRRSDWTVATIRELARFSGFGPPMDVHRRVIVAHVRDDEVVNTKAATDAAWQTYPGCILKTIRPTSGHGREDIDVQAYQEFWQWVFNYCDREFRFSS